MQGSSLQAVGIHGCLDNIAQMNLGVWTSITKAPRGLPLDACCILLKGQSGWGPSAVCGLSYLHCGEGDRLTEVVLLFKENKL